MIINTDATEMMQNWIISVISLYVFPLWCSLFFLNLTHTASVLSLGHVPIALSRLFCRAIELGTVHEENPQVCRGLLQLQHGDVVRLGGADQRSRDIQSLLRAPGWPVSSQVHAIDPHLTLRGRKRVHFRKTSVCHVSYTDGSLKYGSLCCNCATIWIFSIHLCPFTEPEKAVPCQTVGL